MESKESARLKEIRDELKGLKNHLAEQNKQLKRIADIFDKQWHGDANATGNNDLITVTPIIKAVELEKGDTNETEE